MMTVFVKLSGDLPAFQKAFFRNFIALLFILAMMRREKIPFRPEKGNIPALFGRCFCGTVGLLGSSISPMRTCSTSSRRSLRFCFPSFC